MKLFLLLEFFKNKLGDRYFHNSRNPFILFIKTKQAIAASLNEDSHNKLMLKLLPAANEEIRMPSLK